VVAELQSRLAQLDALLTQADEAVAALTPHIAADQEKPSFAIGSTMTIADLGFVPAFQWVKCVIWFAKGLLTWPLKKCHIPFCPLDLSVPWDELSPTKESRIQLCCVRALALDPILLASIKHRILSLKPCPTCEAGFSVSDFQALQHLLTFQSPTKLGATTCFSLHFFSDHV
jgi:hypothetical protein